MAELSWLGMPCVRTIHTNVEARDASAVSPSVTCAMRNIDGGPRPDGHPKVANIANHSDNLPRGFLKFRAVAFAENQPFAERIAFRPELARQGFVDDGYASARAVVAIVECAAAQHGDSQHIEVAGRGGHPTSAIVADRWRVFVQRC